MYGTLLKGHAAYFKARWVLILALVGWKDKRVQGKFTQLRRIKVTFILESQ